MTELKLVINNTLQILQDHLQGSFRFQYLPNLHNMNYFQQFLFLNILIFGFFLLYSCATACFRLCFKKRKKRQVHLNLSETEKKQIESIIDSQWTQQYRAELKGVPKVTTDRLLNSKDQKKWLKGQNSGGRYANKHHSDFVLSLAKDYSFGNPLHYDLHPYLRQMESEVVNICHHMLGFPSAHSNGTFTNGGTESMFLVLYAYREYADKEGVTNPNVILCKSANATAFKACHYLGLQTRVIGFNDKYQMSLQQLKKSLDKNTICVMTSYPNIPYGTADPLVQIGAYCLSKSVPVHVDLGFGGFLLPFMKNFKSQTLFPPGITSTNLQPHTYGLSVKGGSIVLYTEEKYYLAQIFTTIYWPGGIYGTPTTSGSRSGVPQAATWVSLMKTGVKGFTKNAELIHTTTVELVKLLREMGFNIMGDPQICVVAFSHPDYSSCSINIAMKKKGWSLGLNQNPDCLRFEVTPLNAPNLKQLVGELKNCIKDLKKEQGEESHQVQLYQTGILIPDGPKKEAAAKNMLNYLFSL